MNSKTTAQRRSKTDSDASTRSALLAAARNCVGEHGIAQTTSRLIAASAGANLGAITYYFGSKDDLIGEALFGELERRLAPVMSVLETDSPAPARLLSAVQELTIEFERSDDDVPVFLNALLLSTQAGPVGDRGRRLVAEFRSRLAAVIHQLVGDGVIATWVKPDPMASLLISAANGIALQTRLEPGGAGVTDMVGQLAGLLLAASTGEVDG